ncbi:MAG TPA: hypothetical protein VFA43_23680 [Gemmatimonadaceae bacterium]|nr:hypothetical protein [Gemmatimonadaceae bacterium]
MLGVPAASAATTALLVLCGLLLASALIVPARRFFRPSGNEEWLVFCAVGVAVVALPWIGWRFAEDLSYTTKLDSYSAQSAGPIQAYLPGYLASDAAKVIPRSATWATAVGASSANPIAQKAFPALVLITLFPRPSAPPHEAGWIVGWGAPPGRVARVKDARVVHPRQGPLPAVVVAKTVRP